jgi:hypothetical protein
LVDAGVAGARATFGFGFAFGFSAAAVGFAATLASAACCGGGSGGGWSPFTKSGGTPVSAPGTPWGKSGSRSPAIFFLVLNISLETNSVGSN